MPTLQPLAELIATSGVAFGTSGARGLVSQLTPAVCYAYSHAFLACVAHDASTIAVGHDLRPSSPAITQAVIAAISASGRQAIYAGALPTPALASYGLARQIPVIMVTGSHIPFDRNGIKFYRADGEISKADEAAILACPLEIPATIELPPLPPIDPSASDHYRQRYLNAFAADLLAGWRIGLYQHSSVARDLLADILHALGAEVIPLGRTETFVPIDTEAVSEADRQRGRDWAAQYPIDALFSTDGDGDRPLIGDEHGEWLRGDIVGILTAQQLGATHVVTPVSSNSAVERCGSFQQVVRSRIGSPFVIDGMAMLAGAGRRIVGYEANGGFLLATPIQTAYGQLDPLPTRDALLPFLALAALARQRHCPLSHLGRDLPPRFTASDRLTAIPASQSQPLLQQLHHSAAPRLALFGPRAANLQAIDTTDGLRFTFGDGVIIHLRPSGNAPELRCYVESDSTDSAAAICQITLQNLRTILT
jgi:phosphomannomutase